MNADGRLRPEASNEASRRPAQRLSGPLRLELDAILPRVRATREIDRRHVNALAQSIAALGLIEPIVTDSQQRLIAGGHRLEAIRQLREQSPMAFARWFAHGIPVHQMDFDGASARALALQIEIAENEHRRNYTSQQVRDLAQRLKDAGYRDAVGRPKDGEKALGPALEIIVGRSMKTIRKILVEAPAGDGARARSPEARTLARLLPILLRSRSAFPESLRPQLDALASAIAAELRARSERPSHEQ